MKIYLLRNTVNNKLAVLFEVTGVEVLSKHRKQKIYPDLHDDLRAGHRFEVEVLAKPKSLHIGELLEQQYILHYKPDYNDT